MKRSELNFKTLPVRSAQKSSEQQGTILRQKNGKLLLPKF